MTNQKLIEDNMGLVSFLIKKHYPTYVADDDIYQCGMLGLCKAANTWDETKSLFSTYAGACIRHEILNELRRRNKHKGVLSLEYEYNDGDNESVELKDTIVGNEDIDYVDLSTTYDHFTEFEKSIFKLRARGMTAREIGNELGCSYQNVSRQIRKMKRKWKFFNKEDV